VYQALALRCENLGQCDLAIDLMRMMKNPSLQLSLLGVRYQGDAAQIAALYHKVDLRTPESYVETAKDMEKAGKIEEAIRCHLLSRNHPAAVKVAITYLRDIYSRKEWDTILAYNLIEIISSANLESSEIGREQRSELLAYAAFTGAFVATWKGYYVIIPKLLATAYKLGQATNILSTSFPGFAQLQYALSLVENDITAATRELQQLSNNSTTPVSIKTVIQQIQVLLDSRSKSFSTQPTNNNNNSTTTVKTPPANVVVVAGSTLPARRSATATDSIITHYPIQGPEVVLEDGSALSLSEAIMWAKVNPFSPLCNGSRLFAF